MRVEALLKTGTWLVAPLEVRIVAPIVPEPDSGDVSAENIASVDAPSSATALIQLLRYLDWPADQLPAQTLRVRDIIQRNAAEDMLLARSLQANEKQVRRRTRTRRACLFRSST